jgi:hypothetical protein
MALRRFQFTVGQLVELSALSAFVFAALRITPFGVFVGATGLVLPGFLFDRGKGGLGIKGGTLSGSLGFVYVGVAAFAYSPDFFADLPLGLILFLIGLAGLVWGALVSTWLCLIIRMSRPSYQETLVGEACGPIVSRSLDDP